MRSIAAGVFVAASMIALCGCSHKGHHQGGPDPEGTVSDEPTVAPISCEEVAALREEGLWPEGACSPEQPKCGIGRECCCGRCDYNFVCQCSKGEWGCYFTDFCAFPYCPEGGFGPDGG